MLTAMTLPGLMSTTEWSYNAIWAWAVKANMKKAGKTKWCQIPWTIEFRTTYSHFAPPRTTDSRYVEHMK